MKTGAILFIDDDIKITRALQRSLRKESYACHFVNNGRDAFQILQTTDIHVVVSDLNMPEIDGLELLGQVEKQYPNIIRLVLSGTSNSDIIISSINKGSIYRYILKPWDDEELRITIRHALNLFYLQHQKRELLVRLEKANVELEQKVVERTRQLLAEANNAEIGKYASQLVHNLNNSLNGVLGNLELIQESLSSPELDRDEINEYCKNAKQGADHLREIVASILLHVRNERESTFQKVDMNEVILSQLRFFDLNPMYKYNVKKTIDLDKSLPMVMADAVQMKQIIGNLVKNAIDAMEDSQEKNLVIKTGIDSGDIIIHINDTGTGISEEHISKIFSPDFTTKPVGKGTGLGLSSVKEMLDKHSGKIQIESQPGKGTQVTIRLQAKDDKEESVFF